VLKFAFVLSRVEGQWMDVSLHEFALNKFLSLKSSLIVVIGRHILEFLEKAITSIQLLKSSVVIKSPNTGFFHGLLDSLV
jgi:hypothetical protein